MPLNEPAKEDLEQRLAWRRRLIEAVLERKFDDETLVEMLTAGFSQAHAEGLLDAAEICKNVAAGSASARRVATVLENSMRRLVEMNKATDMGLPTGLEPVLSP